MVIKQLRNSKSFLGVITGLISFNYFSSPILATNLRLGLEVTPEENQISRELQETVNTYRNISSMTLNLVLTLEQTKQNITAYSPPPTQLNFLTINLSGNNLRQGDELLGILISEKSPSPKQINHISGHKSEFSWQNLFVDLGKNFSPDQAFKSISFLNFPVAEKKENANSSPNSVNKDKLTTDTNQQLLAKNFPDSGENQNIIPHDGLNHQLVRSVIYNQYFEPIKKDPKDKQIRFNIPLFSNFWFYYFGKGEQDSNPEGLIDHSPESYGAKQLRAKKEIEKKVNNRTENVKVIIRKSISGDQ